MVPMKSNAVPIYPMRTALNAGADPNPAFGSNPFGLSGGFDPGMMFKSGGLRGCGCGPIGGCTCGGASGLSGFRGFRGQLGQSPSLDSIIQNTTTWLGNFASSQLPASYAVPPSVGSSGAIINTLLTYAPYLLVGYLAYKALK